MQYFCAVKNNIAIELLAPAKNAEFGKVAINHGADAVYIGASHFGARSAVANSLADIEMLAKYAHLYRARVYTTLNTILFDNELEDAQKLIFSLFEAGVDGIIIQDMGILEFDLPPVKLIASTQTNNTSAENVHFLEEVGFKRVILARELSLEEIRSIRLATSVELEAFVHGALCVSYSGQCYMSQAVCGRSGNRGVCAQPCRSLYDLVDSQDNVIVQNKHLLSLKDLNLSANIEQMMDSGITSFKIEGRLKDINYVKNVTSLYRQEIDKVLEGKVNLDKSSTGKVTFGFKPDTEKSFNRGFTNYFIEGRTQKTGSFLTQKAIGKKIGKVLELGSNWIKLDTEELSNADGICYFDKNQTLLGTLVNKVDGPKAFLNEMKGLAVGVEIYRNHDHKFEKLLQNETSERKIRVQLTLCEFEHGLILKALDEDGVCAEVSLEFEKILAEKPDIVKSQIETQLSKLGGTYFTATNIDIETSSVFFITAGILNQLRRDLMMKLEGERLKTYQFERFPFQINDKPFPEKHLGYFANVSNQLAGKFYQRHGVMDIAPAFELESDIRNAVLMTTKHCIRYQLDACPVHQTPSAKLYGAMYLKDNIHTFELEFDCKRCEMVIKKLATDIPNV
jgi:23S rRNA 5-hydroxycytidine C2501 synthase